MNLFKSKILVLALPLIFLGCTEKVRKYRNLPPGSTNVEFSAQETTDLVKKLDSFSEVDLEQTAKSQDSAKIYKDIVKNLGEFLFAPSVINNREVSSRPKYRVLLEIFNTGALALYKKQPTQVKNSKAFQLFKQALNVSCDFKLEGGCPNISVLGTDRQSAKWSLIIAKQQQDVTMYFKYIYLAKELTRGTRDKEVDLAFLERAHELAQRKTEVDQIGVQVKVGKSEETVYYGSDYWNLLSRTFHNILSDYKSESPCSGEFSEIQKAFKPWLYSRSTQNLFHDSAKFLLRQAASCGLYDDKGSLNVELLNSISDIQNSSDAQTMGVVNQLSAIEKDNDYKRIFRNLLKSMTFPQNEYFYIVERLYNGHLSPEEVAVIWDASKKDESELIRVIEMFVKLEVTQLILLTNKRMANFFEQKNKFSDSFELLREAVSEAQELHTVWDTRITGFNRLQNLAVRNLRSYQVKTTDSGKKVRNLEDLFLNLRNNIKYVAVYPNMLMFVYLMAHENFSGTIQTFWGPFTVSPSTIVNLVLEGRLDPWFNFGNDKEKLDNQYKILYAYYFTLITETFSTFSRNKAVPVSEGKFFTAIIEKYIQTEKTAIRVAKEKLQAVNTHKKMIRLTDDICREEERIYSEYKVNGAGLRVTKEGNYPLRDHGYLDNSIVGLENYIGLGATADVGTPIGFITEFYRGAGLSDNLMYVRNSLQPKLLFIENMLKMTEERSKDMGLDFEPIRSAANKALQDVKDDVKELFTIAKDLNAKFRNCAMKLYKREHHLQSAIIDAEAKYLEKVYDDLVILKSNPEKLVELQNQPHYQYVDADFSAAIRNNGSRGKLSVDHFSYSKVDVLLRMKGHLKEIDKTISISKSSIETNSIWRSPSFDSLQIDWSIKNDEARRADFVVTGLQIMGRDYLKWHEKGDNPFVLIDELRFLIESYKLGPINFDLTKTSMELCADSSEKNCIYATSDEIIDYNLEIARFTNLTEDDTRIIKLWGEDTRLRVKEFTNQLYIEEESGRPVPLFNFVLKRLVSDDTISEGVSNKWLSDAKLYYDTQSSMINFFFVPEKTVQEIIMNGFKPVIQGYEQKVRNFLERLDYRSTLSKDQIYSVNYKLHDYNKLDKVKIELETLKCAVEGCSSSEMKVTKEIKEGPKYYDNLSEFTGQMSEFHRGTGGEFRRGKK